MRLRRERAAPLRRSGAGGGDGLAEADPDRPGPHREEALRRIAEPAYDEDTMKQDFEYVATKLDLTVLELQALLRGPNKSYRDYKSSMPMINLGTQVLRILGLQQMIIR